MSDLNHIHGVSRDGALAVRAVSGQSEADTNATATATAAQRVRRIITAGAFGTVVEYFDFSVYAFLATVIAEVFFAAGNQTVALLYTLGVFGASFVLRPLGGILIGHLSDRYGRRPALTVSVAGMAFASTAIGVLPSFATIGATAPVLLFLLRCIQGLSAGGELGGPHPTWRKYRPTASAACSRAP